MAPFLIQVPTDTDLWMFLASNGGITAGRRDPDGALFPYETVDRLYDTPGHAGPVTLVRWRRGRTPPRTWAPLAPEGGTARRFARTMAKHALGHQVVFEELDHDAALAFRCRWAGSDETGWVRTAWLTNLGADTVHIRLLDGLLHLLPAGVSLRLMQQSSCLVDAYTRADVDPRTGLATVSLTAAVSDRPEPAEVLRTTVAWCHGLPAGRVALSGEAVHAARAGAPVNEERILTGRRANYLVTSTFALEPGQRITWHLAADTARSHADVARLASRLADPDADAWIERSLAAAGAALRRIVAGTDALQCTGRAHADAHHLANVLYNDLRGGVFVHHHGCPRDDFAAFLAERDRALAARHAARIAALPDELPATALHDMADASGDPDLRRLAREYLPLYFGRRHGDPSRPWNRFSIVVRHPDGSRALRFEGNWRDVFQNWEALALTHPAFLPGMIARFLDASTMDGFNPYRITRDGVEWEVPDPDDPWSGIGYWGDHQIVYLLRLLEALHAHAPGTLEALLPQELFAYADVPYRLSDHTAMLQTPRTTIAFEASRQAEVAARVAVRGRDGACVHEADGTLRHASLLEKLLVPVLAKLSSFVPGGGIWMNTQRPEWNDANNALAGIGLSVVTTCHLHRHLMFLEQRLSGTADPGARVAIEVVNWLREVAAVCRDHEVVGAASDDDARRTMMDALGDAATAYRRQVYAHGLSERVPLSCAEVVACLRSARAHLEHTIRVNRREDGLWHAYNTLDLDSPGRDVHRLELMLEGQVAVLGAGLLGTREVVALLDALFASPLYDNLRGTFLLYPPRTLKSFMDRNCIPDDVLAVPLVARLLAARDPSIVLRDPAGVLRFAPHLRNAGDVVAALDRLAMRSDWDDAVAHDRAAVLELFERVFHHRRFTGRSGAMYGYEGIGCVYWHMVSKLLLAVQEVLRDARDQGDDAALRADLARAYLRIRDGLGFERTAGAFGAFPTDPYSHSPAHGGARQPGMTGQVKEEILARFGELGVRVRGGHVAFEPLLLTAEDFLNAPVRWRMIGLDGVERTVTVPAGALAFTYLQVPVLYTLTDGPRACIRVTREDGSIVEGRGGHLPPDVSRMLLDRTGGAARIEVDVPRSALIAGSASRPMASPTIETR